MKLVLLYPNGTIFTYRGFSGPEMAGIVRRVFPFIKTWTVIVDD